MRTQARRWKWGWRELGPWRGLRSPPSCEARRGRAGRRLFETTQSSQLEVVRGLRWEIRPPGANGRKQGPGGLPSARRLGAEFAASLTTEVAWR